MEQYAYIRVSTKEQNVERQIFALEPYHCLLYTSDAADE